MTTTLYSLTTLAQQYSTMLADINQEIELSSQPTSGPFDALPVGTGSHNFSILVVRSEDLDFSSFVCAWRATARIFRCYDLKF